MPAKPRFFFLIDILAACNLRCPTCPVGNSGDQRWTGGTMSPDLLRRILQKATDECDVTGVALYNWTEPLLHPQLPEMIRLVNEFGLLCDLSTNLNRLKNPEALLRANPHSIVISLSGFTQEIYSRTHTRGDIERVKENLIRLAAAKRATGARTHLYIRYHRYRDNLHDEIQMRQFAREHDISFQSVWAFMMPLEKTLAYLGDTKTAPPSPPKTTRPSTSSPSHSAKAATWRAATGTNPASSATNKSPSIAKARSCSAAAYTTVINMESAHFWKPPSRNCSKPATPIPFAKPAWPRACTFTAPTAPANWTPSP